MFSKSVKWFVVLTAMLALGATACKKKSKSKKSKNQVEENEKNLNNEVKYGVEYVDGNSKVFRGTDKSFEISVTPYQLSLGGDVMFVGKCGPNGNEGQIRWDLGNGQARQGLSFQYRYPAAGTYNVIATCTDDKGSQKGNLTIEVRGSSTDRPGQNPNQNPG